MTGQLHTTGLMGGTGSFRSQIWWPFSTQILKRYLHGLLRTDRYLASPCMRDEAGQQLSFCRIRDCPTSFVPTKSLNYGSDRSSPISSQSILMCLNWYHTRASKDRSFVSLLIWTPVACASKEQFSGPLCRCGTTNKSQ